MCSAKQGMYKNRILGYLLSCERGGNSTENRAALDFKKNLVSRYAISITRSFFYKQRL